MDQSCAIRQRDYTEAQRQELVGLFRSSVLTQSEFARKHGLKLNTLQYWLYRTHRPEPPPSPGFKEISLPVPLLAPAGAAEIAVGPEITLRLGASSTPEFIAQVIHHLRRLC